MKNMKSDKPNNIPNEVWKLIVQDDTVAHKLAIFFSQCFKNAVLPKQWDKAVVVAIFKKGDKMDPSNYRPITLLDTCYKLYARIVQKRIEDAIDGFLRETQYGFRKGRSTISALFILRRLLEWSQNHKDSVLYMLFLDWRMAFDKVGHSALLDYQYMCAVANIKENTGCVEGPRATRGPRKGEDEEEQGICNGLRDLCTARLARPPDSRDASPRSAGGEGDTTSCQSFPRGRRLSRLSGALGYSAASGDLPPRGARGLLSSPGEAPRSPPAPSRPRPARQH